MNPSMDRRQAGFTLLEVMIAMSILAIGAASILGIFVAVVQTLVFILLTMSYLSGAVAEAH